MSVLETTADLREVLVRDLQDLRTGKLPKSDARARAYVAKQIIDTLKIEVAAHAMNMTSYQPVMLEPARAARMPHVA